MDSTSKPRLFSLLNERTIRTAMTNLYVSIMEAPDNAKMLLDCVPAQVTRQIVHGNDIAKDCFVDFCRWLDNMKNFSFHGKIFEEQIVQPIKLVAGFIKDTKDQRLRTAKIRGFVFSKSIPYSDNVFGISRVTVSMIVPSIRNVVSIRCSEELSKKILLGRFYNFSEVKPLPLVNRVHQYHPVITEANGSNLSLLECDFLKICFDDVESLSKSVEMENFTEIASSESNSRHYLGAALVLSGKIISVRAPRITIQNALGNNTATMLLSTKLYENMSSNSLDSFNGKFVRMLIVCWYDSGLESEDHPKSLEVFYVEESANQSEVILDDIVGFVRLRRRVSKKTVEKRYPGTEAEKIPVLLLENEVFTFHSSKPEDPMLAKFVETDSRIRDLRSAIKSEETPVVKISDILDPERVSSEIILRKIKNDEQFQTTLLTILKIRDISGMISTRVDLARQLNVEEESLKKMIWWLSFVGLVSKNHEDISLTKKGSDVLYKLLKNELEEFVHGVMDTGIISIPDMEQKQIIPSLLVRYLKEEGHNYGMVPYLEKGNRCELFWLDERSKNNEQLRKEAEKKIQDLISQVFLVFRKVSYPLTTLKILEELKKNKIDLSYYSATLLLSKLERGKKLRILSDSWVYDLESRVLDLISQEPSSVFAAHVIAEKISVPSIEIDRVRSFLNELATKGIVKEIRPGLWTASENSMQKCKEFLKALLKNSIFDFLKSNNATEMSKIKGMVGYRARELCAKSIWKDANKITDEAIMEMVQDNKLILKDGMYKIKKIKEKSF